MPAIVVLGGHRCGTSSIAGTISELGIPAALPGDEIGPAPANPRGHFEDRTLVRLHQRMLGPGGWRNPQPVSSAPPLFLDDYDAHLRRRAAAAGAGWWLVKDPRLCFLLPVLIGRLRSLVIHTSVVGVTRSSAAAADSLRRRHRMSPVAARRIAALYDGAFRAQLGWLASHPPTPLLQLDYDAVLNDRLAAVQKLAQFLELEPTAAAVEFLDPGLRHQSQNLPIHSRQ